MICAACHNPGGQTEAGYCNECKGSGHMTTGQAVEYESLKQMSLCERVGLFTLYWFVIISIAVITIVGKPLLWLHAKITQHFSTCT